MVELDYFSKRLQDWYLKNKRKLPWRDTRDPYIIWLSEIILQQTQVKQGLPYFEKFSTKYPSVDDLANAHEDQILRDWQGLGYYSRARNLHSAAKQVRDSHKSKFPDNYKELLKLRGVGNYTAAAIASFAFGEAKAVVDGNAIRVLSRFMGIEKPVDQSSTQKEIQLLADDFIDKKHPDIHNQAIMELGALICRPSSPQCNECPLEAGCSARENNSHNRIPFKKGKTKVRNRHIVYFVVLKDQQLMLKKRRAKDIWSNLFDFPLFEVSEKLEDKEILEFDFLQPLLINSLEIQCIPGWQKHQLSHQSIWAKFLILHQHQTNSVELPQEFENSRYYSIDESRDLGKPILIVNFLNQYIY